MEKRIALFIDFENIARGVRLRHPEERVDLRSILDQLEEQGRLLVKRAYGDWGHFKDYRSDLLQNGIEPVQVFAALREREGWKNGADIRIAIDAVETAYRFPEITDFVIVSGDSDFLSLVTRLRENGKTVWGVGLRSASSQYLMKSCDHFLVYEEIVDWLNSEPGEEGGKRDSRALLLATVRRMSDRQGLPGMPPPGTPLKVGAVAAAMRRMDPGWDERFEGYPSFLDMVRAHEDLFLLGQPLEGSEFFLAERGTLAEVNLRRMLDARLPSANGTESEEPSAAPTLSTEELIAAIRLAARELQGAGSDPETPQHSPVRSGVLRARLQQSYPGFHERQYGYSSFVDLVLSLKENFRTVRADARDPLVAECGSPAEQQVLSLPEATSGGYASNWAPTPAQSYLGVLRQRRIRHVPMADRYKVIQTLCTIFAEAQERGDEISLKDAKDRLHQWFEANDPAVPWDSVNNTVYHLFWTYCFEFGEAPEDDVPLWDRPTRIAGTEIQPEDVMRRCDVGLTRMISENVGTVDPRVMLEVLGDGAEDRRDYFEQVCSQVNQRYALGAR